MREFLDTRAPQPPPRAVLPTPTEDAPVVPLLCDDEVMAVLKGQHGPCVLVFTLMNKCAACHAWAPHVKAVALDGLRKDREGGTGVPYVRFFSADGDVSVRPGMLVHLPHYPHTVGVVPPGGARDDPQWRYMQGARRTPEALAALVQEVAAATLEDDSAAPPAAEQPSDAASASA